MIHSVTDLEQIWTANGGNPVYAPFAAAVALAESSGNDQAHSPSNDWGLWQINRDAHPQYSTSQLLDPNANAKIAIAMSNNGTSWQPWCTAYSNPNRDCGHGGASYLAQGSPVWAHVPAGATLPPGAAGTPGGGQAGTAGAAGSAGSSGANPNAQPPESVGCVVKTPKGSLGPVTIPQICFDGPVGAAVIVAGVGVMLVGTVVVLSRFSGTRQLAQGAVSVIPGGGAVAMGARAAGANVGASRARSRPSASTSSPARPSRPEPERLDDDDLQALDARLGSTRPDTAARRRQVENRNRARRRAQGPARPRQGFTGDRPSDFAGGPPPR